MRRATTACASTILAAVALGACAASATASEFIAAPEAPVKAISGTAGEQEFHLGPFTITCAAAKGTGAVLNANVLSDDVKFSHCEDSTQLGEETLHSAATFRGRVGFAYTATGLTAMGRFSVAIKGVKCVIVAGFPEGGAGDGKPSILADSSYTGVQDAVGNLKLFPSGFQQKLSIGTQTNSIEVNYEGACQGFSTSEEGSYSGTFTVEAVRGNLEGSGEGWNRIKNKEE